MQTSELRKRFLFFIVFAGIVTLFLIVIPFVEPSLKNYVTAFFGATDKEMGETAATLFEQFLRV